MNNINDTATWHTKRCPVCGDCFKYVESGYTPKTCKQVKCVQAYLHNPDKYQNLIDLVDKQRLKANI